MLTNPWKCAVLHCNHLGNTWKPLVLMIRHFDYCPSASEGDNQSVRSSAPVVSRCFPGGYNVKLYISRGRLAWWLLAFLQSGIQPARIYSFIGYVQSLQQFWFGIQLTVALHLWTPLYTLTSHTALLRAAMWPRMSVCHRLMLEWVLQPLMWPVTHRLLSGQPLRYAQVIE